MKSKATGIFCHAAPDMWNLLPLSVRRSDTVSQFKINLKSHYLA